MQKVTIFLFCFFIIATSFYSPSKDTVQWLSLEEMQVLYKQNPKPIIVDVYTSWCGWCKVMDKETYGNAKVIKYINENFYAVKLDAESKSSLVWNDKKYEYKAEYKSNDLAVYLLQGQMSFPTTVFLSKLDAQPAPLPGFFKPKEIEPYLKFFGTGEYKTKIFSDFMKSFSSGW